MIYNKRQDNNPPKLPHLDRREQTVYPVLESGKIAEIISEKCSCAPHCDTFGNGKHTVFLLPEAAGVLESMISYGRRSPMNVKEQKFIGLGHFFDGGDDSVNIVVSHFIQVFTTNRTSVSAGNLGPDGEYNPGLDFLEYYRNEYLEYEKKCNTDAFGKQVDPFLDYGTSEFVLEGHTHPDLGVFWSSTDKESGRARAGKKPVCIFVCDPVRKQMLGCVGSGFENAKVVVCKRQQTVNNIPEGNEKAPDSEKVQDSSIKDENITVLPKKSFDELCVIAGAYLTEHGYTGKLKCRKNFKGEKVISFKMTAKEKKGK